MVMTQTQMREDVRSVFREKVLDEIGLNNIVEVETETSPVISGSVIYQVGTDLLHGFLISRFNKETNQYDQRSFVEGLINGNRKSLRSTSSSLIWICDPSGFQHFVDLTIEREMVNKSGKWVKRLANALKKHYDIKLSQEQKQHIGNLINGYGQKVESITVHVDITNSLNWDQGDYYDRNKGGAASCFWGEYNSNLVAMDNDSRFYALRFYENNRGSGRCWFCVGERAIVLFNSSHPTYELSLFAKVLSTILDKDVVTKKIDVYNDDDNFYVNSGRGIALTYNQNLTSFELGLDIDNSYCSHCDCSCLAEDLFHFNGYDYCESCYNEQITVCACCNNENYSEDMLYVDDGNEYVCEDCYNYEYSSCEFCNEAHKNENMTSTSDGSVCEYCYDYQYSLCYHCDEAHRNDCIEQIDDKNYCDYCKNELFSYCDECEKYFPINENCDCEEKGEVNEEQEINS